MNDSWNKPHRRFNPLLREWVLVSPHRTQRPWQGKVDTDALPAQVQYDPHCYLCPGNARAGGLRNPDYKSTFAFNNDFPALLPEQPPPHSDTASLLKAVPESGICRVACFSPRHDLTMSRMSQAELCPVIDTWTEEMQSLESTPWIRYVQIFENRGTLMGASNPHPHCQIWASSSIPDIPQRELHSFDEYQNKNAHCLLCDYLQLELQQKERIVCENEAFVALVPFWAVWPFELLLLSKHHLGSILEFTPEEKRFFADLLRRVTIRYDNLFQTAFPYSMGLHQRPSGIGKVSAWHFHAHFLPPLLRSATIRKFMVGFELLATPQRDMTAEDAASRLAALSEVHYLEGK
jgi:UDPglucose--hexose-1-phosphate uridylyltransferase